MILHVESRPGPLGEPEPTAFHLGDRRVTVLGILDRWPSSECTYFKVETDDASSWILRHIHATHEWEVTLYQSQQALRRDVPRD